MTPEQARETLLYLVNKDDPNPEDDHFEADNVLCELLSYLGYDEIVNLYQQVPGYYS